MNMKNQHVVFVQITLENIFATGQPSAQVNCSEIFTPVITDTGVCCAFNLHMEFKESQYSKLVKDLQVIELSIVRPSLPKDQAVLQDCIVKHVLC